MTDNKSFIADNKPFKHIIINDFLNMDFARQIEEEFPSYTSDLWFEYNNPIEQKKTIDNWRRFGPNTYTLLHGLMSRSIFSYLEIIFDCKLWPDFGLHGGGLHIHGNGGNLNPHLDYSIHPKLKLQRKLNLILYLSEKLQPCHGGHLGLWEGTEEKPNKLITEIFPKFNRAIIFDTTQNSWHGMTLKLNVPQGIYRKSIAVYYLCKPVNNVPIRERALFVPREDELLREDVLKAIKER